MEIACASCGAISDKPNGSVNRARKINAPLYCNKVCSGRGRQKNKPDDQKKLEKRLYDIEYRRTQRDMLKTKKREYFQRTYDPAKAAIERRLRMPKHIEYCRQDEYRKWKKQYDRQYRAKKFYGPLWECFLLTLEIRDEALKLQSDYEIRVSKGTVNKCLRRKQDYERNKSPNRKEPEIGPLDNLERSQRR